MSRFKLIVEYDGRPFMGWQRQPDGPTVQLVIEQAIKAITGIDPTLHAAGRTDAGVHGEAMVAHVDLDTRLTPFRLMGGINAMLRPHPVSITACAVMPDDWHARFSCTRRRYIYRIIDRRAPLALDTGRAWRVNKSIDAAKMHAAAQVLVGTHDFTTFRSAHCQSATPVKTLDRLDVSRMGEKIEVEAAARSFLQHQVRSMVGCLAMVGKGRWSIADLKAALVAKDRAALGFNAPPDGLYFVEACYD